MLKYFNSFLLLGVVILFYSCSPKQSEMVVASFGDHDITLGEFEKAYAKNAGGVEQAKDDSLSQMKEFLDLYLNFKMKLRDAKVRGFDDDKALQNELEDYKRKVGVSYLLDKKIVQPGIEDLFNKRKWEIRVSHILIRPDTSGDEAARQRAQAVLDSIKQGASFEEMAAKYSQDQFSRKDGGDVYYFTAGMLPVDFEDAAYSLEPGEVYPEVVKTQYGYHLIKVTEKQKRIPQVRASHIMVAYRDNDVKSDSAAAAKVDTIMNALESGMSFEEAAGKYSDDTGTNQQGGDLGWITRRRLIKPLDEAIFTTEVGEVTGPIKTDFGYHFIKVTDIKKNETFDEVKDDLKKIFEKTRYHAKYDSLIASLRKKYNYSTNPETFSAILEKSDSVMFGNNHPAIEELGNKVVLTYDSKELTFSEFMNRVDEKKEFSNKIIDSNTLKNAIEKVGEDLLLEEAALDLDKTDPVFADLMKDYRNGIYIFKLQEDEVWNRINIDSTGLMQYYEENKEDYKWPDRVSFKEIFSRSDSLINYYYQLLDNGADFDSVVVKYTERPGYKEKVGFYELQNVNSNEMTKTANELETSGDYSKPFKSSGGYSIVQLIAKEPSRIKTFEEAKAEVSGAYQEAESKRLENEYLMSLKKRYNPEVHYKILEEAYGEK